MFCLKPNPVFTAPVFLTRLGEVGADGKDSPVPVPVRFCFKHKTAPQLDAWIQRSKDMEAIDWLMEIVERWDDGEVVDEQKQPIAFSREAFIELLDAFAASTDEIFHGYLNALRESRRKN